MRLLGLAVVFAVCLLVSLFLHTPLSRVQPWFPEIARDGERFSGTVSDGAVFDLNTVNGLFDIEWDLTLSSVLRGAVGADIRFVWDSAFEGTGHAAVGLGRVVRVRDVQVTGPAQQLDKIALPGVLRFQGDITLDITEAAIGEQHYGPVTGTLAWAQSAVVGQVAVALGDLTLSLIERDGATHGELSNEGGDISLSGTVTLTPEGEYQTDILAVPAPGADRSVQFTLESIAERESENRFRIRESGSLTQTN